MCPRRSVAQDGVAGEGHLSDQLTVEKADIILDETTLRDILVLVLRRIKNQRIAIVEDDNGIRGALESYFQDQNQVLTFATAEEAIQAEDSLEGVTVFIIDYKLPGKDGVELFQHLRLRFSEARYILVTGEMSYDMLDHTRKLGLDALLLKPFDLTILEDNISSLVAA